MTDQYAVIGNPVAHSKSPLIHAEFARQIGEGIAYATILAPLDGFKAAVTRFRNEGGKGLNITLPFKQEAWCFVETHSAQAIDAGAVNTIEFRAGGVIGHNTDGIGLVRDLKHNLGCPIHGKRVLLMGAGGAVYGVMEALLRELPELVVVANRTPEKAGAVVGHFEKFRNFTPGGITAKPYPALSGTRFDLVINATSAGLSNALPPLPDTVFAPGALAYDMVYGKTTPFLGFAGERGVRTADGTGMLVEQAAESFHIWRGVRPDTAPVIELLRRKTEG